MVTIMGLPTHCAGTVRYGGATIAPTAEAMVASGAVLVPERRAQFADMSVGDNLALGFYPRRAGDRDPRALLCEVFAICPRLEEPGRLGGSIVGW
jgi:branched-chain amino acid transport system ATP-binding protein